MFLDARLGGMGIAFPPVRAALLQIGMDLQRRQSNEEPDEPWGPAIEAARQILEAVQTAPEDVLHVSRQDLMIKGCAGAARPLQKALSDYQIGRLVEEGWSDPLQALASAEYDHDMVKFARRTFAAPLVDTPSENWQLTDAQLQTHLAHLCQHPLFPEDATCHHVPRHLAAP